jgi:predicted ATPase
MMNNEKPPSLKFSVGMHVGSTKNACYLLWNNWDDYGFRTTFDLYFVNVAGEEKHIGRVSITSKGLTEGHVDFEEKTFYTLPEEYCSLGQGQGYYEELMSLADKDRENILIGLRDCVFNQDIFEEFKEEKSVQTSLMRHVSLNNIKKLFPSILKGNAIPTPYHFTYKLNNNEDGRIQVNVIPESNPPSNIHVLIGRNGVGKTRILSGIADCFAENKSPSEISVIGELIFEDDNYQMLTNNVDRFTNLLTVSFSAFDKFKPIRNENIQVPCQYIGLKDESGTSFRTPESLESDFNDSLSNCLNSQRKSRWVEAIKIINSDPVFRDYELDKSASELNPIDKIKSIFSLLSSGHKIILFTITKLVEHVDDKTLLLMDEPETHLHPPLLSSFIRAISDLLIKRNAVAIIATHSPVVLQEVSKSCITKIDRSGDVFSLSRPRIETYAENIGTLTREIFQLELMASGFYKTISDYLAHQPNYEKLMSDFENEIGAEGRAIARTILHTNRNNDA